MFNLQSSHLLSQLQSSKTRKGLSEPPRPLQLNLNPNTLRREEYGEEQETPEVREAKTARPSSLQRLSARFSQSFAAIFSARGEPSAKRNLRISKIAKPTYYMASLEVFFKTVEDSQISETFKEHFHRSWKELRFVFPLFEISSFDLARKKLVLPPSKKPVALFFELEKCLVTTCPNNQADLFVEFEFGGRKVRSGVKLRPHALEVLTELSQYFEINVWSSSHSLYVNCLVKNLDLNRKIFTHVLSSKNCLRAQDFFIKPFEILNRSEKLCVLIDHSSLSAGRNPNNLVPIVPFLGDQTDNELLLLRSYLVNFRNSEDVRPGIRRFFQTETYQKHKTLGSLFNFLFQK